MKKEKTAVELVSEGLFNIAQEAEGNNIFQIGTQNLKRYIEVFKKQAKEIEKKHIEDAFNDGWDNGQSRIETEKDYYYNKTFE
jgi:hypothetical protein